MATGAIMNLSIETLKQQAKRLRASLTDAGSPVSHSRSLELIARQHGFRDWNTAHAAAGNRTPGPPVELGQAVSGHYLGQAFTGTVIGVRSRLRPDRWRVTLQLDAPVDVVTFDSFSAYRSRITVNIGSDGLTDEKTSAGVPHMQLAL